MEIPAVESFEPTDTFLLEISEKTRIQMSAVYFEPNWQGQYWLDETAPTDLLEVVAFYRRALGREEGMGSSGASIEDIKSSSGHHWVFTSKKFMTGAHLAAGAAWMSQDDNGVWGLEWIYIHPFERGGSLLGSIKSVLDGLYPGCVFCGPFSTSGRKACLKLAGGDEGRLCG